MQSALLICLVIAITDGDTLKADCSSEQVTIRLAEIDSPEKEQELYLEARQSLSDLCLDKEARIATQTKDRYGRIVARVNCNGTDANAEQVKRGMAWVYDRYVTDHSLYELQNNARSSRHGLWSGPSPVPPWEWRKLRRD